MEYSTLNLIRILKFGSNVSFILTCFGLAGYMIFLQFKAYIANEDSSVVSYKTFNQDKTGAYPTFTICLFGRDGRIFKRSVSRYRMCGYSCLNSTKSTQDPSKCNKYCSRKDYWRTLTGNSNKFNINSTSFEDNVIDLRPILLEYSTRLKEGNYIKHISNTQTLQNKSFESIFTITYLDANQVCYTKEWTPEKNVLLHAEYLMIDVGQMLRPGFEDAYQMHFFVHHRGQLLRQLGTPDFVLKQDLTRDTEIIYSLDIGLRINSVDVLTKRRNAVQSCNPSLKDEDKVWITNAVNVLGCLPPFLNRFLMNSSSNNDVPTLRCNRNQYHKWDRHFNPRSHVEKWATR